ncbi:MAG: hypothetical protein SPI44_01990 [Bacilli bacterium]|nr:hypothetical protein [Bacilli bacterium]
MKIFFNIFRGLIIAYLIVLAFLFVILYVKKNSYHEDYLDVNGYSYYKIDNATLEPDIRKNNIVILKNSEDIEVGDYVTFLEGDEKKVVLRKVVERNEYRLVVNVTNNYENKDYKTEINIDDVKAKMIYNNNTFSSIMNILLNPVILVILFFLGTIFPEFVFNK